MGFGTLVIINTFSTLSKQNVIFFGLRGNSRPSLETFQRRSFPASVAVEPIVPVFIFFSGSSCFNVEHHHRRNEQAWRRRRRRRRQWQRQCRRQPSCHFFPIEELPLHQSIFLSNFAFFHSTLLFRNIGKTREPPPTLERIFFPLIVQYPQRR